MAQRIYNTELQNEVDSYLKQAGLSQAKAAPLMGISQTTLSQWRNGCYDNGNIKDVEDKIAEYMKLQREQIAHNDTALPFIAPTDYVPISTSEDVYKLISYCQLERGMVILHGDAGIGKTKGAERYVRENPYNTIYIQATPSTGTLTNVLKLLARALKIPDSRSKMDLMWDIRAKLEGSSKVIIIDEAQHLKLAALEEIRTLSDTTITGKLGTGIVLIGNTEVYGRMLGKQEARFAQLFSRVKMNRLFSTRNVTKADIEMMFPFIAKKVKEIDFLYGISQSKWGIRGAVNVYNNAINNENYTYDGMFMIARTMGIGSMA